METIEVFQGNIVYLSYVNWFGGENLPTFDIEPNNILIDIPNFDSVLLDENQNL